MVRSATDGHAKRPRLPAAEAAIISGSGLAVVPAGLTVEDEIPYAELGWPLGTVVGHRSRLLVASGSVGTVALACGRSHRYEGFSAAELERPVRDLAAAGVRRLVITCATGSLAPDLRPGDVVVAHTVIDLQRAPRAHAPRLEVCSPAAALAAAGVLAPDMAARTGVYVAVSGPQYETPAEAAWLGRFGDVVGMSAVHEVRAAGACGLPVHLVAAVTNRAGASLAHEEVLTVARDVADGLQRSLGQLLWCQEAWPADGVSGDGG